MISAVLDTNTIVAETIVPQGMPAQILQAGLSQRFHWVTSLVISSPNGWAPTRA